MGLPLKHKRDREGWWYENPVPEKADALWCGPYRTRAEMEEDRAGIIRTVTGEKWVSQFGMPPYPPVVSPYDPANPVGYRPAPVDAAASDWDNWDQPDGYDDWGAEDLATVSDGGDEGGYLFW